MDSNKSKKVTIPISFVGGKPPDNFESLQNMSQPQYTHPANLSPPGPPPMPLSPYMLSQDAIDKIAVSDAEEMRTIRKEERSEAREMRRFKRERALDLAVSTISQDQFGDLRICQILENGERYSSPPLFSKKGLAFTVVAVEDSGQEFTFLSWEGAANPILIRKLKSSEFQHALARNGIVMAYGRDKQREVVQKVFNFLLARANYIFVPSASFGWIEDSTGGWLFLDENSTDIKQLREWGVLDET